MSDESKSSWTLTEGDELGGYRVVKPLGRGGMGEVYLVENVEMGKRYAMKLLSPEHSRDPTFRDRFRVEARVMADLRHPGIVQVHNMGEEEGRFFLVMDYVEAPGGAPVTLGARMKKEKLHEGEARDLAVGIARALDYAHTFGEGVVHRDLKPGNVLLGADDRVRVSDFGLAKVMGEAYLKSVLDKSVSLSVSGARTAVRDGDEAPGGRAGLTQSDGAVLGTFEYMAPEQKEGTADARSDIYSLGLIIYRMLTGRRAEGRFPDPSKLGLPGWWDRVIEKSLAPDPGERYATAAELLADLERAGERAPRRRTAGAPGRPRGGRALLVLAVLAGAPAVAVVLALLLLPAAPPPLPPTVFQPTPAVTTPPRPPTVHQPPPVVTPPPTAQPPGPATVPQQQAWAPQQAIVRPATPEEKDKALWAATKREAESKAARGDYGGALAAIRRFLDSAETVRSKPQAIGLWGEIEQKKVEEEKGRKEQLEERRQRTPRGLFEQGARQSRAEEQRTTERERKASEEKLKEMIRKMEEDRKEAEQAPASRQEARGPGGGWEKAGWIELRGHRGSVRSVAFSPDGRVVATGSSDRTAALWEVSTGRMTRTLVGHRDAVLSVSFSPDGRHVATGSDDNLAALWDVRTGARLKTFKGPRADVYSVAFSPDGRFLATASDGNNAALWGVRTGRSLRTFEKHRTDVKAVAFSPDGRFLATGSNDDTAALWDVPTGRKLRTFEMHRGDVKSVAFSPDGRFLATGSDDDTAALWDVSTGMRLRAFRHGGDVRSVAFSPDGRFLATGSHDDTAALWDVSTAVRLMTLGEHGGDVNAVAFSPDGRYLATGSTDRAARIRLLPEEFRPGEK